MTTADITEIISKDKWMMDVLSTVEKLNLPDWWIGAGFVRSKIWDYLHNFTKRTPVPDIDVIYFDKKDFSQKELKTFTSKKEEEYQKYLTSIFPHIKWSVTNQARMHAYHNRKPYKNSLEALSEWSETATCIGVKLIKGKLIIGAPWGIEDLINLKLTKIPNYENIYKHDPKLFITRIKNKQWTKKWPKLNITP